jgi:hypothetical protein
MLAVLKVDARERDIAIEQRLLASPMDNARSDDRNIGTHSFALGGFGGWSAMAGLTLGFLRETAPCTRERPLAEARST